MYLRFETHLRHARSGRGTGVFSALYALERQGALAAHELAWFRETEAWFNLHLPPPDAAARAEPRAVAWFKASATEHVSRFRALVALLAEKDILVEERRTERPGYILYEDPWQVSAIPVAETP